MPASRRARLALGDEAGVAGTVAVMAAAGEGGTTGASCGQLCSCMREGCYRAVHVQKGCKVKVCKLKGLTCVAEARGVRGL